MPSQPFKGKVVWITGASSGIGAALALALSSQGALLLLSARNVENLEKVKANCTNPDLVTVLPADMAEIDSLPEIAAQAWSVHDKIDYVFLNAGFAVRDRIINTEVELIKKVMDVNFFSAVVLTKALLPLMKARASGHFVVTSSLSGKYGIPQLGAYSASKHALHGFFDSLRAELETDEIKITLVIPGLVKTDISVKALKGDGSAYGKMQESISRGISPEACAKGIIQAVANGKNEVLIGGSEIASVWVKRLFPGLFSYLIRKHPLQKLRKLGVLKKRSSQETNDTFERT
ncbi:SDR family oxidoreductase [Rufibacter latericius]|uniref:SDR family oxidoreductase n=1 Tax=Rufibacter latericius TaxID=2487040 RepID=A0A3M9MNB3_9BACT|nr:SDR family oxidoreductase [Rufibacter latericius]RNI27030.1 SDR family oxidoreductase [Rufibacter latericius]